METKCGKEFLHDADTCEKCEHYGSCTELDIIESGDYD
jgi:hypothetical protein